MRRQLFIILLFLSSLASAERQLATFTLHYADPARIEAVVRTYLSPGSSVSVYQQQLIVNATPEELEKTRALIQQLDIGGRQLLISVKTSGSGSESYRQAGTNGPVEIKTGKGIETRAKTTITVRDYQTQRSGTGSQGVRATEGQPTYVSTGVSAPISNYRTTIDGRVIHNREYVNASTGFYATAWVNDDTVRIRLEQQREKFEGKNIQSQQLQTEVNGAVGTWIAVGALSNTEHSASRDILHRSSQQGASDDTIFLKVELLRNADSVKMK